MSDLPALPELRHYPELDGRTFLLGIGGMKCATSWVHAYLDGLPGMTASPIKELHFFNARLRPPGHEPMTEHHVDVMRDFLERASDVTAEIAVNPQVQGLIDCLRMHHDANAYFDLFARICTPETRALCEITPQYAVLGRDGFDWVRRFFASQKMTLKVVFILRDPVERLWSHLRHLQQRSAGMDIVADWPRLIRQRGVIERSDYWQSVEALDAVFPERDLLYLFYEDLFDGEGLRRLCDFAGLPFHPPERQERRNETSVKTPLPATVRSKLLRVLGPQYAFCRERFGEAVPAAWQG